MESVQHWIRDNCNEQKLQELRSKVDDVAVDITPAHIYIFLLATGVVYLVAKWTSKKQSTKSWLKIRPRSPDPEKSSDVAQFAEKKMKPSDRPPGS